MTTLKEILIQHYGYRRGDFGSTGHVRVDCEEGTISPVPLEDIFTPHSMSPNKVVSMAGLFRPAQGVTLRGIGREPPLRFTVVVVASNGLTVETPGGTRDFLSWSRLRHGMIRPEMLVFDGARPANGGPG